MKGMVTVQHESLSTVGFGVSLILQYQTSDVSYRQEHPALISHRQTVPRNSISWRSERSANDGAHT